MKRYAVLLAAALALLCSCNKNNGNGDEPDDDGSVKYTYEADAKKLIRNPMMGWVLYDDANDYVSKATDYWAALGTVAEKYGSIFYWRSRWSELEPTEGHYAWNENENFKALIQGALDRGLHIAFRVYVDGQDNIYNGTPDFVREAGAKGYSVHRLWDPEGVDNNWTPYADDPVFQEKFENFIHAFAKEFDDPSRVDFVDGYGLGWWGEGHHLQYLDAANKARVYQWITGLYGNSFKNVILVTNIGTEMGIPVESSIAIDGQGYIFRKDSIGSQWFGESDINDVLKFFPAGPFIAECCYWGSASESYHPWDSDYLYKGKIASWADYYKIACNDALKARANCLDLRENTEVRGWITKDKEDVERFMVECGYRFTPVRVIAPASAKTGKSVKIAHEWMNSGVGMCPNNNRRWNYKYKVAFALLQDDSAVCVAITDAEPSGWLKEKTTNHSSEISFDAAPGTYTLAIGIVDTSKGNTPGIMLAAKNAKYTDDGWLKLGDIEIQ